MTHFFFMTNTSLPCGVVLDRHVPKTAGTTVRSMLRENSRRGSCEYVGYDLGRTWQSRVGFKHRSFAELVHELQRPEAAERRLCAEAHMVAGSFWSDLATLRASAYVRQCRIVVMVRVREPFSWYVSFYNWAVRPRQRTGLAKWGLNFTDWLPYNLQSRYMLHGSAGTSSEWADEMAAKARPNAERRLSTERWAQLVSNVRAADVAAPLERLDDALAMTYHLAGFLSTVAYNRISPASTRGPWDMMPHRNGQVQDAHAFCGSPEAQLACRAAVHAAARDDHRLYKQVTRLFDAQWARLGPEATRAVKLAAPAPAPAPAPAQSSPRAEGRGKGGGGGGRRRALRRAHNF